MGINAIVPRVCQLLLSNSFLNKFQTLRHAHADVCSRMAHLKSCTLAFMPMASGARAVVQWTASSSLVKVCKCVGAFARSIWCSPCLFVSLLGGVLEQGSLK